uniref:(northern house mosquito) hypothetical protein n=1 Tax=Culex pipiens TaxID=7175 RepID=A0A8D8E4D7_CULPI
MGLVRGGTRNSGTVSSSLRSGWPPRMDGVRASVLSDLECTRGGTIFGREIDTLAAGGDASNRENRRNIVLAFIFQMLLFPIYHTLHMVAINHAVTGGCCGCLLVLSLRTVVYTLVRIFTGLLLGVKQKIRRTTLRVF